MGLESKTIPGFFNGISQQASILRLPSQGELQVNALGTLVDGLVKRPPVEHVATLSSTDLEGCVVHRINRDIDERYLVFLTGDATEPIEVYTLAGVKCTMRYGILDEDLNYTADDTVKAYVTASVPSTLFKVLTVSDFTFILRTDETAEILSDVTGGTVTGTVQGFLDLPSSPATNVIYKVTGDDTSEFDDFYVKYDGTVWNQTVKPGIVYKLDRDTMPHKLVRTDTAEFTFSPIDWGEREVGDDISCPQASFIANEVKNIFFYKNRLSLLSEDNIIMSRSGDYYNFWNQSALDLLDDDPIDVSSSVKQIETLRSASVFDKSLLLLADQQQFDLSSGDSPFTAKTVALTPTTNFEICTACEPVSAGANVYFATPKGDWMAIREYFIQPNSLVDDASDITAHVPSYIPNGFLTIVVCSSLDIMLVLSDAEPDALYVYKYYWAGDQKPQSAWSKWDFDGDILGITTIGTALYMATQRTGEVSIEKILLEKATTGSLDFRIHLDRQVKVTGTYSSATDMTQWTLPYLTSGAMVPVNLTTGRALNGIEFVSSGSGETIYEAPGDHSGFEVVIGKDYQMTYRLTPWHMQDSDKVPMLSGRLQTRSLTLSYKDTGYFRVEVTAKGRDTMTDEFSGVVIGVSVFGSTSLQTGKKRITIMAEATTAQIGIINDTYLPCAFQNGSWEGFYHSRS